jgi:hypothetical protein
MHNKLYSTLVIVALTGLLLGVANVGGEMLSGFCRAFGAVFFIVAFLVRLVDKAEAGSPHKTP